MNGYIKALIAVAVIAGIIRAIVADHSAGTKKYVSFITGLVMITVIIMPFKNAVSSIGNIKEYVTDFFQGDEFENNVGISNSIIVNTGKERICQGIKEAVISKFGFETRDVYVDIKMDTNKISAIKITEVDIILTNRASWSNVDEVKGYIQNLVGVKVNVTRK